MANIFNNNLKRDVFETLEEYKARIDKLDLILVGEANLIKENYNISTSEFLLKINWNQDFLSVPFTSYEYFLILDRDSASNLYSLGPNYPIYAKLQATIENTYIEKFILKSDEIIPIDMIKHNNKIIKFDIKHILSIEHNIKRSEEAIQIYQKNNIDYSVFKDSINKNKIYIFNYIKPFVLL